MKTKRILFEDISSNVTAIATATPVLNKSVVKQRIRNTTLQSSNISLELETWTPEDEASSIHWKIAGTVVGEVLVASTKKGICFLGFTNGDHTFALSDLQRRFPENTLSEENVEWLDHAIEHLNNPELNLPVPLHLKGSDFQLNIWKKLMRIPFGGLTTYGELGNSPRHARATGAAVGANPVSYILPCHRVVRSDGSYHTYFWGPEMKRKLLACESANFPHD
jgi:AraC family transcriptional regulator, regulatory protein of adaptative response / methylated-DNA-[protein]-cysteine methyltransferase